MGGLVDLLGRSDHRHSRGHPGLQLLGEANRSRKAVSFRERSSPPLSQDGWLRIDIARGQRLTPPATAGGTDSTQLRSWSVAPEEGRESSRRSVRSEIEGWRAITAQYRLR